jgi:pyruvate kinase
VRRAKIVATLGPASSTEAAIRALLQAGMDVARLNFSHGSHAEHRRLLALLRRLSREAGRAVAVLQDLQGAKLRTGPVKGGQVPLRQAQEVLLLPGTSEGDAHRLYINYPHLLQDVRPGQEVLLSDGLLRLKVLRRTGQGLLARVLQGGILRARQGVNLPQSELRGPALTEKDREDILLGLRLGVDMVALSFVRSAKDVLQLKAFLASQGAQDMPVVAKIERPQAVRNISEILEVADGIMVARGDLGVEMSSEEVPLVQKALIREALRYRKLSIVATEMLLSMLTARRPSRAESSDVANAVLDGADALMLSQETSIGQHPVEALRAMARIIQHTERALPPPSPPEEGLKDKELALASAAVLAARRVEAPFIVAFTHSGYTARLLSSLRPSAAVLALCPSLKVAQRLAPYWGVGTQRIRPIRSTDGLFKEVQRLLLSRRLARKGQTVVITAGLPRGSKTNLLKLHTLEG